MLLYGRRERERERERLKFSRSMVKLSNKLLLVNKLQYYIYIDHHILQQRYFIHPFDPSDSLKIRNF